MNADKWNLNLPTLERKHVNVGNSHPSEVAKNVFLQIFTPNQVPLCLPKGPASQTPNSPRRSRELDWVKVLTTDPLIQFLGISSKSFNLFSKTLIQIPSHYMVRQGLTFLTACVRCVCCWSPDTPDTTDAVIQSIQNSLKLIALKLWWNLTWTLGHCDKCFFHHPWKNICNVTSSKHKTWINWCMFTQIQPGRIRSTDCPVHLFRENGLYKHHQLPNFRAARMKSKNRIALCAWILPTTSGNWLGWLGCHCLERLIDEWGFLASLKKRWESQFFSDVCSTQNAKICMRKWANIKKNNS